MRRGKRRLERRGGRSRFACNCSDAAFAQVKLWQDLNQDGVSQANELFALADHGIASIGLSGTAANTNLGNGNTVGATAVVTRSDGTTTTAADLNLAHNPFFRRFTTDVPVSQAAQALPQMGGAGWVRDLREAMSLGTAQAQALLADVQAFASGTTKAEQLAQLDPLIRDWAATNEHATLNNPQRRFVVANDPAMSARLQAIVPLLEIFNGLDVSQAGMQAPVISTVTLADGTTQQVQTYNRLNNTLVGTSGGDSIYGGDGNDTINAGNGDDRLLGGAGDDTLNGGIGRDTLHGGTGNDVLNGGDDTYNGANGSDLYLFNLGDGIDTIQECVDYYGSAVDVLRFGAGIAASDIRVVRNGVNLELQHANGSDKVIVANWFATGSSAYYQVERVEFADGSVWLKDQVSAMGLDAQGSEGNDVYQGSDIWGDTYRGLGGNDTINGNGGNDRCRSTIGTPAISTGLRRSDWPMGGKRQRGKWIRWCRPWRHLLRQHLAKTV